MSAALLHRLGPVRELPVQVVARTYAARGGTVRTAEYPEHLARVRLARAALDAAGVAASQITAWDKPATVRTIVPDSRRQMGAEEFAL